MSFRENPTAFLNPEALQFIVTAADLDLPPPESSEHHQPYAMASGERYQLYSADRLRVGHYIVKSWSLDDRFGAIVAMDNLISQSTIYLTTSQLVFLETHRRLRPDNGKRLKDNSPGAAFRLSDESAAQGKRYLGYIDACLEAAHLSNTPLRRGMIERVCAERAALIGDKKPSYNTIRMKIEQYCRHSFDALSAVSPGTSSGNRTERFPDLIEELLADAVERAWRLSSGDWKDVKRLLAEALKLPANAHLYSITHNENGRLVRPSNRTIQRRFGAVDKVQRTLWRYGAEYAKKHFDIYMRQALPDHPLDIVDVDFTPINVIVVDDERPIIYGRPHIIAFRDRKTGSILGYAISFKGATFEAFLEALKMAIMPKDMSRYPGLEWKQYGTFLRLGVDNDMALINDHMRWTLSQLGIQLVEYRPGHPWEKGGVERLFQILNQDVVHNLPGATMSNVIERQEFLEKHEDVPKITLQELEDFITHYICSEYHTSSHSGLGMLRTLNGVPNKLWEQGIKSAKQRRPFDPDVLVRAVGNVGEVTIQKGSIRWDNLIYSHPDLLVVHADARHKAAVPGVNTTTYKAWRDPADLGEVHLYDHHNDRVITVPVQPIDAWYAKGLRLYQHMKITEFLVEQGRDTRDFEGALDSFSHRLQEINRIRGSKKTRQALARLHAKASKKFTRSRVVEIDHTDPKGALPIDLNAKPSGRAEVDAHKAAPKPVEPVTPALAVEMRDLENNPFDAPKNAVRRKPAEPEAGRKYASSLFDDDDDISALLANKEDRT